MKNLETPDSSFENEERLRQLIESGEAVDAKDAAEAIKEGNWAKHFRELNRERAIAGMTRDLAELDRRWGDPTAEPLSREEEFDRHDLRFELAIAEAAADNPDEREFLLYQYLLDVIGNELGTGAERETLENAKRRLERKSKTLGDRIGADRTRELYQDYRRHLQELFDAY